MKSWLTVVALVNGMIGGLILVLPILTINTGTVLSIIVLAVTGFFSFYSCYLCLKHLGNHTDLDKAMYHHFGSSQIMKNFYNFLIFLNLCFILLLYFNLIVEQWKGLLPYNNVANPICNAVALLVLVFLLNYFHMGAKLMGYGIISIIAYCIFLIWVLATAPNPSDGKQIPMFGNGGVNLASAMNGGFAIQMFFIPVLKESPNPKNYVKYTLFAYIIGGMIYTYIAYAGAYGVLNRKQILFPLSTIQDYFNQGQWQVAIIQVIYLIHLYSAFGKFLLVCKKRFFSMFTTCGLKESNHGQLLNPLEILFAVAIIGAALGIYFANVSIELIIEINGAVIGFFFVYLMPASMHFKCLYLPKKKPPVIVHQRNTEIFDTKNQDYELSDKISSVISKIFRPRTIQSKVSQINPNCLQSKSNNKEPMIGEQTLQTHHHNEGQENQMIIQKIDLECKCTKPKITIQVIDILAVIGMIALGLFIMIDEFIVIASGPSNP